MRELYYNISTGETASIEKINDKYVIEAPELFLGVMKFKSKESAKRYLENKNYQKHYNSNSVTHDPNLFFNK